MRNRIPAYKGPILKSIAKSWSYYYNSNGKISKYIYVYIHAHVFFIDKHMCSELKQVYKVFEAACQGQHEVGKLLKRGRFHANKVFILDG